MDESLAQSLRVLRVRAGGIICGSLHLSIPQSSMGWVILYKTVGKRSHQAVGLLRQSVQVARDSKEDVREASYAYQVIYKAYVS